MSNAVDAIIEIFTWIGFGAGALVAGIALLLYIVDGTWVPVRAVIESIGDSRVARWFDGDGGVGEAHLSIADAEQIGDAEMADVFVRAGYLDRVRLTRRSPAVRSCLLLAAGLVGVGVVCFIISFVMLFARG